MPLTWPPPIHKYEEICPMQDETKLPETVASVEGPDPFDLANLRIMPDYDAVAVKPLLLTVPVRRKPKNQHFVRVRPEPEFRADLTVIELEDDKDGVYLVIPSVAVQVHDECRRVSMFTAITRDGHTFLWAVPLPGPDGKDNEWNRSNREAVSIAMRSWVRVTSKHELGAYI